MSKEKKIEIYNYMKLFLYLIIGFIAIGWVWLIISLMLDLSNEVINWGIITLCIIYFIIIIFSNKCKEKVTIKTFLEMNSHLKDERLVEKLEKHGFTENEIEKILKDRPKQEINIKESQIKTNTTSLEKLNDLKEDFNISNKLLTNTGLGIVIDSKAEEIAIIQLNEDIRYVKFNQIHSYKVNLNEVGAGNNAMAMATWTGNSNLYQLGMANTLAGNKDVYAYVIQLILNDVDASNININILHKKMLNSSGGFKEIDDVGKEITSFLDKIISKNESSSKKGNLSEIKELKELLDMGAITQEEFDNKKKELLK